MGGDWITTGMFVAAIVCVLACHWLSMISLGQTERRDVIVVALLLVLVTALMTGVLRRIRSHKVADRYRAVVGRRAAELKSSAFNSLFVREIVYSTCKSLCNNSSSGSATLRCPVEARRPGWRLCRRMLPPLVEQFPERIARPASPTVEQWHSDTVVLVGKVSQIAQRFKNALNRDHRFRWRR